MDIHPEAMGFVVRIPKAEAREILARNNVLRDGWGRADVWYINTAGGRKDILAQDLKTKKWWLRSA